MRERNFVDKGRGGQTDEWIYWEVVAKVDEVGIWWKPSARSPSPPPFPQDPPNLAHKELLYKRMAH